MVYKGSCDYPATVPSDRPETRDGRGHRRGRSHRHDLVWKLELASRQQRDSVTEHGSRDNHPAGDRCTHDDPTDHGPTDHGPTDHRPSHHRPSHDHPSHHGPGHHGPTDHGAG
jgi:hypothetical protein